MKESRSFWRGRLAPPFMPGGRGPWLPAVWSRLSKVGGGGLRGVEAADVTLSRPADLHSWSCKYASLFTVEGFRGLPEPTWAGLREHWQYGDYFSSRTQVFPLLCKFKFFPVFFLLKNKQLSHMFNDIFTSMFLPFFLRNVIFCIVLFFLSLPRVDVSQTKGYVLMNWIVGEGDGPARGGAVSRICRGNLGQLNSDPVWLLQLVTRLVCNIHREPFDAALEPASPSVITFQLCK